MSKSAILSASLVLVAVLFAAGIALLPERPSPKVSSFADHQEAMPLQDPDEDVRLPVLVADEGIRSSADLEPETVTALDLDLDDLDDFTAFVSAQPAWSADDERFEEKYAGFPDTKLLDAKKILNERTVEDRAPWIAQRMASGDFVDITGKEDPIRLSRPGRRVNAFDVRHMINENDESRSCLFEFYEEEYPLLFYRVRELAWINDELWRREHK